MPSTIIRFYFDYESPNAYLAWTQLPRLARRYGFTVDPVPILYAATRGGRRQRPTWDVMTPCEDYRAYNLRVGVDDEQAVVHGRDSYATRRSPGKWRADLT